MKARTNKIRMWIYVLFGLFFFWEPTSVGAQTTSVNNQLQLYVSYGFDNNIKVPSAVPVQVEVVCVTGPLLGTIQVEVPVQSEGNLNASVWMSDVDGKNNKEQCYIWEKEIALEPGESAEEQFYIELPMNESCFNVKVVSNDEILAFEQVICDYTENNSRLMLGVISDRRTEIAQLNGMQIGGDNYYNKEVFLKTISLEAEDIYTNPWALEQLDILIVDKGTQFSSEQRNTIDIWVNNGGLYCEREEETLSELIVAFQHGEYAQQFQSILMENGNYPRYSENFDDIPLKAKIPIGRYIIIILLYLIVVGPGLYFFLQGKKKTYWLIGSVCAVSFLFISIIYFIGRSTNMGTPVICHQTLYEQDGKYLKETIDFSTQAYQMQDFILTLKQDYQILPKGIGTNGSEGIDAQMAETITIKQNNSILLENMSAYRQNCFLLEHYNVLPENEQITFQISGDGDALQIHWSNPTQFFLKQAVVVYENRVAILGEVKPNSNGSAENTKLYSYSNNGMHLLFQDLLDFSDYAFPEYEVENLVNVIWETLQERKDAENISFVIGILENDLDVFDNNIGFEVYGTSLMKIQVEIDWSQNQVHWCPNLEIYGDSYKGEYISESNLLESKEAIMDYTTSHIGELLSLEFVPADYIQKEYYVPFDGKIYLFNWKTGMFTELIFWDEEQYNTQMEPYVSNTGILRVYYVMDEWLANSNRSCVLPCIKASGKVE